MMDPKLPARPLTSTILKVPKGAKTRCQGNFAGTNSGVEVNFGNDGSNGSREIILSGEFEDQEAFKGEFKSTPKALPSRRSDVGTANESLK